MSELQNSLKRHLCGIAIPCPALDYRKVHPRSELRWIILENLLHSSTASRYR